ncbi:hypothetical protein DMUE_2675 [Dictyocoela muelleri]|nr:hypothetical protein DMUE_2675 [Dictyocoela muelleri]
MFFSENEQFISKTLACNSALTLKEIKKMVQEKHNVNMSIPTIFRKIKKIGMTRKRLSYVPIERNTIERINERKVFAAEISRIQDSNLVILDETGFNEQTRRYYGYSLLNSTYYIYMPANRGINRSLLCALNSKGIIGYELRKGAFNSELFMRFIEQVIVLYFNSNPNSVLILDNARIHKIRVVLNLFRANRIVYKSIYLIHLSSI